MVALDIYLLLVFFIGVSSGSDTFETSSPCALENARLLPIYDLKLTSLNVLEYVDILESLLRNKFYQFDDVGKKAIGGMFYESYPVLVVHQPDENIPELHGYYFPWGLQLTYDTDRFSSEIFAKYRNFRDFLNSSVDKEGYTPSAALQMYPELKSYKLTKIIDNAEEKSPVSGCAVLFVFPKKDHRKSNQFEKKYKVYEKYNYSTSEICKVSDLKVDESDFDAEDDYVPLWTIFGHKVDGNDKGQNIIDFNQLNEYYSKYGYYQFEKFDKSFRNYSENPTLIVFQPDEKIPELHGCYFSGGIQSLISYMPDPEEDDVSFHSYKPFFDYTLKEAYLDGLTPDAAHYDYPYFFDFKLTKFIYAEDTAEQFVVLFLAPSRYRPESFEEKYYAIEDYGIGFNGIVEYRTSRLNEVKNSRL